jgi:hypothetical protein
MTKAALNDGSYTMQCHNSLNLAHNSSIRLDLETFNGKELIYPIVNSINGLTILGLTENTLVYAVQVA